MRTDWEQAVEQHRGSVRGAILDAAGTILGSPGHSLTMSGLTHAAGVSRATLYRYFPDTQAVLRAHHDRHVDAVLRRIEDLDGSAQRAVDRLSNVVRMHVELVFEHHHSPWSTVMREGPAAADRDAALAGLVQAAVDEGDVRSDIPVDELVRFIVHASTAATEATGVDAARRVAELTLVALRTAPATSSAP